MRPGKNIWGRWLLMLGVLGIVLPAGTAFAADTPAANPGALTNWLVALNSFRNAGTKIGEGKHAEAKTKLAAAATNLATPYGPMAAQFATKLGTPNSPDTPGDGQFESLIQLCA